MHLFLLLLLLFAPFCSSTDSFGPQAWLSSACNVLLLIPQLVQLESLYEICYRYEDDKKLLRAKPPNLFWKVPEACTNFLLHLHTPQHLHTSLERPDALPLPSSENAIKIQTDA